MAVTRKGRTITMTADGDSIAAGNYFLVSGITFQGGIGVALAAGERLRLTDAGGSVLCDYVTEGTTDNADLMAGRKPIYADGLLMEDGPATGTWVLTIFLE
jgi:hypothetical protein